MNIKNVNTLVTHDGKFHADEIFAIAILKLINPKIMVIRTRNSSKILKADLKVDVGRKYDQEKGYFDHHQIEFKMKRENGIPYASAGLIWREFGKELVNSKESFDIIDKKIILPIDAVDNGLNLLDTKICKTITIRAIINSYLPYWEEEDEQNFDKQFKKANDFAIEFLSREIKKANGMSKANLIIDKEIKNSKKKYILLELPTPPWKEMNLQDKGVLFVVYRHSSGKWASEAVPKDNEMYEYLKLFPEKWAGLIEEDIAKETGVKGALFCHKKRFIVAADSKEAAIKLTELALGA